MIVSPSPRLFSVALAALLLERRVLLRKDLKEFFAQREFDIDWRDALRVE